MDGPGGPTRPLAQQTSELRNACACVISALSCRVGNIMSENLDVLHSRGERLRNLNDKTEDIVNDAQSFATLARQLAQQKSRKWWQF